MKIFSGTNLLKSGSDFDYFGPHWLGLGIWSKLALQSRGKRICQPVRIRTSLIIYTGGFPSWGWYFKLPVCHGLLTITQKQQQHCPQRLRKEKRVAGDSQLTSHEVTGSNWQTRSQSLKNIMNLNMINQAFIIWFLHRRQFWAFANCPSTRWIFMKAHNVSQQQNAWFHLTVNKVKKH